MLTAGALTANASTGSQCLATRLADELPARCIGILRLGVRFFAAEGAGMASAAGGATPEYMVARDGGSQGEVLAW